MLETRWTADLFKIGAGPLPLAVAARVAVATGVPLVGGWTTGYVVAGVIGAGCAMLTTMADIGTTRAGRVGTMAGTVLAIIVGGTIGARFGGTTYADEGIVLIAAWIAGWVSASHPGIAAIARFGAIATAAGAGLQFTDPMIAIAALAGGALAIVVAIIDWWLTGTPPQDNLMDWRAGLRRALSGADTGARFATCYALAAAVALFFAEQLGVLRPYWATITVMMVMRREGLESLKLVIHYMAGTLAGIVAAAAIGFVVKSPLALALIATAFAAFARIGFAVNPALGFTAFTVFAMLSIDVALQGSGAPPHVLSSRLYDVAMGCALALVATLAARTAKPAAS